MSLVPDFVTTLMKPLELRPNSAGAPSATTWNSWTASRFTVNGGRCPPRCSPKNGLLLSAPSMEILLLIPFCPFDGNLIAVGALHNRNAGRKRDEVEIVPPVVRKRLKRSRID